MHTLAHTSSRVYTGECVYFFPPHFCVFCTFGERKFFHSQNLIYCRLLGDDLYLDHSHQLAYSRGKCVCVCVCMCADCIFSSLFRFDNEALSLGSVDEFWNYQANIQSFFFRIEQKRARKLMISRIYILPSILVWTLGKSKNFNIPIMPHTIERFGTLIV